MLILSRKRNEEIVVTCPRPCRIVVAVAEINGDKARIGVEAPPDVVINRREVQDAMERQEGGQ